MTPAEAFIAYRRAAQRARSRVLEHHLEDIAVHTNPWLFGPKTIMQAIQIVEDRGGAETVTSHEVMNFLAVARFDALLDQACALEGLPTVEEWLQLDKPPPAG